MKKNSGKKNNDSAAKPAFQRFASIIQSRRQSALMNQGYLSLIGRILLFAACIWLCFSYVFALQQMDGSSMFPYIKDGDVLLGYRLDSSISSDDVISYQVNGNTYIGRVIASSGDFVVISSDGTVTVNGATENGALYLTQTRSGQEETYWIGQDEVFVLADFRTQGLDSRDFGPISLEDVNSRIFTVIRRRGI